MTSAIQSTPKKALIIIAVIHDDVPPATRNTLYADYFRPLVKELESFTERRFHVVFTAGQPYCNFDYKGDDLLQTLQRWEPLSNQLLAELKEDKLDIDKLTKVVLLTNDGLNAAVLGGALVRGKISSGKCAIASLVGYSAVGHEIGHLLGATHEDYEIQYNGWVAQTYMAPSREILLSNSYTFSPANRKNIINYLADKD